MSKEIVLITGTNSGFGLLTATSLARKGYQVIATMRDISNKTALLSKAREFDVIENIEILQLDVNNNVEINEVIGYIQEKYHQVDILINNAGYCLGGFTEDIPIDDWKVQFNTNFFSIITLSQAVLPLMREKRRGKIINIGSISGRIGFPGMAPYSSSKFALEGLCESLRLELLPFNINVSIIEAGSYRTKIWGKTFSKVSQPHDNDYTKYFDSVFETAKHSASNAADPNEVVQLLVSVCRAKNPKLKYQIGRGVRLSIFLKSILPWSIFEWFVKKKLDSK